MTKSKQLHLASWNIPTASVLFVGDDAISDIQGATAVGMRALRVGEGGISSILQLEQWPGDPEVTRFREARDVLMFAACR